MSALIIPAAIGAIIGFLASLGFKEITSQQNANAVTFLSNGQPVMNVPNNVLQNFNASNSSNSSSNVNNYNSLLVSPLSRARFFLSRKNISSSITSKPSTAQLSISNPVNGSKLLGVSIIPDANSKLHLFGEIDHNDTDLLINWVAGDLTDLSSFSLPIPDKGIAFNPNTHTNYFLWTDGNTCNVTILQAVGVD